MTAAVYRAKWVLPVSGPPISGGAIRVGPTGLIEALGPTDDVRAADARVTDLGTAAILPGLVNVHVHPELTILRGRLENAPFPDWIERLIELKYRTLSADELQTSTWLGVAESIAAGVTCLAAPDDAGSLVAAMVDSGLRGRVYREVFGPDPKRAGTALAELGEKIAGMRDRVNDLVDVGISPHAPYTVSAKLFTALAEYATDESLPVCIHAAESEAEEMFLRDGRGPFAERLRARGVDVKATGRSAVAWLADTGIMATHPLLVHCVRVDEYDIARIAHAGAAVAQCPISNAKFGHGVAPLVDLLAAEIPVGLGSDSVASSNRVDLLEEARFAGLMQNARERTQSLDAGTLLHLATLGGARALGLADKIGSLEIGKEADLCGVRLDRPHTVPIEDPTAAMIHSARGTDVCLTVVRGRVLYRDGEFATLDWPALAERAATARHDL